MKGLRADDDLFHFISSINYSINISITAPVRQRIQHLLLRVERVHRFWPITQERLGLPGVESLSSLLSAPWLGEWTLYGGCACDELKLLQREMK